MKFGSHSPRAARRRAPRSSTTERAPLSPAGSSPREATRAPREPSRAASAAPLSPPHKRERAAPRPAAPRAAIRRHPPPSAAMAPAYALPPPPPRRPPTAPAASPPRPPPPAAKAPPSVNSLHIALRRLLVGREALRREAALLAARPRPRAHTALTRAIVIFADFLADISAFDVAADILRHPAPAVPLSAAVAGLTAALLAADLLSAVAHWAATRYFPPPAFDFLPHTPPTPADPADPGSAQGPSSEIEHAALSSFSMLHLAFQRAVAARNGTEAPDLPSLPLPEAVPDQPPQKDVFDLLVNSCALSTPMLVVLAGWAASVDGANAVFSETFCLFTISFSSFVPLIRSGHDDIAPPLQVLKSLGLLKKRGAPGWCQLSGFWDRTLSETRFFDAAENMLFHGFGVCPNGEDERFEAQTKKEEGSNWPGLRVPSLQAVPERAMVVLSSFLCSFFLTK